MAGEEARAAREQLSSLTSLGMLEVHKFCCICSISFLFYCLFLSKFIMVLIYT